VLEAEDHNGNHISDLASANVTILAPPPPGIVGVDKALTQPVSGVASVGQTVIFTINVTNIGPGNLTTVSLVDTYNSTALTFDTANPAPDSQVPLGVLTWNDLTGSGNLAPGSSIIVTVNFTAAAVTSPGPTINNATVTGDSTNATDFASVTIRAPEIHVEKEIPVGGYIIPNDASNTLVALYDLTGLIAGITIGLVVAGTVLLKKKRKN
jgi:hypothetical protein